MGNYTQSYGFLNIDPTSLKAVSELSQEDCY